MNKTEVQTRDLQVWREMANAHFLALDCVASGRPDGFFCSALVARLGDSLAAELCVSESRVIRRRIEAENSSQPFFKLFWQLGGKSRIRQGPHESVLEAGMWTVYDTAREYSIESSERSRFMVLLVPQSESRGWTRPVAALAGKALPGGGVANVVLSGLAAMLRDGSPLDESSQHALQDSTVTLLECALQSQVPAHAPQLEQDSRSRLERVQSYILGRLGDGMLTPDSVARVFGISRRSLYNLFLAGKTTPRAYIQEARLARARALLSAPSWRGTSVSEVAREAGFADPAHFSRAFHATHGAAPSAWRRRQVQPGEGQAVIAAAAGR